VRELGSLLARARVFDVLKPGYSCELGSELQ